MSENKYDDNSFFEKYKNMPRSQKGLASAGEWETFKSLLPPLKNKRVLDLGCGFGWHCQYAAQQGAFSVTGIDISEKMLKEARNKNNFPQVKYMQMPLERIQFAPDSFDVVISSLCFHYIKSFKEVVKSINELLVENGDFVFSAEHPLFTAHGDQEWIYDNEGNILYFPIDNYFQEGVRKTSFLNEEVLKYHRTLTSYLQELFHSGFAVTQFVEPQPSQQLVEQVPEMADEFRRPMMFIVAAKKITKLAPV